MTASATTPGTPWPTSAGPTGASRSTTGPKAPGRNEPARHAVVSASPSPLVTYIGDDDLFLPHHLESMQGLLVDHDFAHPAPVFVQASGELLAMPTDLADPRCVEWHLHPGHNAVSLTGAAHTRDLYRRLPFGWRTGAGRTVE